MKKLEFAAIAMLISVFVHADTETVGDYTWTYRIVDGKAEIYNNGDVAVSPNPTGTMMIPSTLAGMPVASIGDWAFCGCVDLTGVTIPNAVTNIGVGVFSYCDSLENIVVEGGNASYKVVNGLLLTKDGMVLVLAPGALKNLVVPESVTTIGRSACEGSSLTNVVISKGVEEIEAAAFWGCDNMARVEVPDAVSSIGAGAFSSCYSLDSISVGNDNNYYKTDGGLLLTKDGKRLVAVPGAMSKVSVPEGVTEILESVFDGCYNLLDVHLPDSLVRIGDYAFELCQNLPSIEIPGSVGHIGTNAFSYCWSLTNIVFSGDAPEMECGVFEGLPDDCTAYVSRQSSGWDVEIPGMWNGVQIKYLEDSYQSQLTYTYTLLDGMATITGASNIPSVLEIPSSIDGCPVVAIGRAAFQKQKSITEVVIPDSVNSIEYYAFQCCSNLVSISIGSGMREIGNFAFYSCASLRSVSFANGIASFGTAAFQDCGSLETVALPSSVTSLSWQVFKNCPSLRTVYMHTSLRDVQNKNWFENSPNVSVVYYNCQTPVSPPPVTLLSATDDGPGVINVSWGVDSEMEISTYKVFRSLNEDFASAEQIAEIVGKYQLHYEDCDVSFGVTNYYWIVAVNDIFEGEAAGPAVGSCNGPISIGAETIQSGVELFDYEYQFSVEHGNGHLRWYVEDEGESGLPPGLNLSWDGWLTGVPVQCGTYTFTVTCYDWRFLSASASAVVTLEIIENDNRKPSVTDASPLNGVDVVLQRGSSQQFNIVAADPDGKAVRYVWMIDGVEVQSGLQAKTLLIDSSDLSDESGAHEIISYVNDDLWTNIVKQTWNVYVPDEVYVDAINGDDGNDGLTAETALASLDAANWVSPYSMVHVSPGTYYGGLFLGQPLTIEAINGVVTIDACGMEHCIRYSGSSCDFSGRPVVRGCVLQNGTEAAAHVDLERCVIIGNGAGWIEQENVEDEYYYVDESVDHAVLYDCNLNRCTVAGNTTIIGHHPLSANCTFDVATIIWGNGDELDEVVDPRFTLLAKGDCRLRDTSPYIINGVVTRGALDDIVTGYVISSVIIGPGALDKSLAVVNPGDNVTFSVVGGSHPLDHFEANGLDGVADGNTYTFANVQADATLTAVFVSNIVFYVDANNGNDMSDGFSRSTAVATLQTAIDRSADGDTIIVSDGTYAPIDIAAKRIVIESENGYKTAIIDGGGTNRCVNVWSAPSEFPFPFPETNAVIISGFTLVNGRSPRGAGTYGGIVERCLIKDCFAYIEEPGYYVAAGGEWGEGGGAYGSHLRYCTVVGNTAEFWRGNALEGGYCGGKGGGVCECTLEHCIVWNNEGEVSPDCERYEAYDSCISTDPHFVNAENGDYRLFSDSPCVAAGVVVAGCEAEIVSASEYGMPDISSAQAEAWIADDLAQRFAKPDESAADYESRFVDKFGADPVAALNMPTDKKDSQGNDMYVWQDYVAGTDPTDTNSVFTANVEMVDGLPVVTWEPKLSAGEEARRIYTIYGKTNLTDRAWHSPTNEASRFFKVGVEMR